ISDCDFRALHPTPGPIFHHPGRLGRTKDAGRYGGCCGEDYGLLRILRRGGLGCPGAGLERAVGPRRLRREYTFERLELAARVRRPPASRCPRPYSPPACASLLIRLGTS